jgi:hypothetical protein
VGPIQTIKRSQLRVAKSRLKLEEQTGADLIYYNETYRSFVLVQYKSMDRGLKGPEFRWRKNDKLSEEIARMDVLLKALGKLRLDGRDHRDSSDRECSSFPSYV